MAKKILIIDDEPDIALSLGDRLKLEGYEVVTAEDAKSGIEQIEKENPDIVVLDIMLPDRDGFDVCNSIKNDREIDVKVIMTTGKIDAVDAVKAREAGADEFTVKTPDYAGLVEAIRQFV